MRYYLDRKGRVLSQHRTITAAKKAAVARVKRARGRMSIDVVHETRDGDYIQGRVYREGADIVWSPV